MPPQSLTVILADTAAERIQTIRDILVSDYGIAPICVKWWDELVAAISADDASTVQLVIMSYDLPGGGGTANERIPVILNSLRSQRGQVILLVGNRSFEVARQPGLHVLFARSRKDKRVNVGDLRTCLSSCIYLPLPSCAIQYPSQDDYILIEMVRSLGRDGDFARGNKVLALLVRNMWCCTTARVSRLTQGYSGAKVLRIEHGPEDQPDNYALKICTEPELWKLRNEIDHWQELETTLSPHGLVRHVPKLVVPRLCAERHKQLVCAGGCYAVAYQFLGSRVGTFLSLRDAYVDTVARRQQLVTATHCNMPHATLAEELIRQVVDCLDDAWYRTAIVVNDVALWDVAAAEPDQLLIPPPYKLTARQRAHLLGVLEEFSESSRFGPRLFPRGTWVTDSSEVCRWLTSHPASNPICTSTNSAVLSPVHGDLNSNNILLWLERSQPFLIDFACFQSRGHTLQDFARLEVEVKFTLMDRDQDSTLDALDHTPAQLTRWCELEKQLTSTDWSAAVISASSDSLPIQRAANLIIDIRQRANAVHSTAYTRAGVARSHFLIEYNAALLYHTLRAIGYDTLSPFKRLLAVYSAARLIRSFEMR